ncbi:DUF4129 domain-containing protein [Sphingosinicella sp. YJ22]|uniref:DUF4129 domain-containing protein n=1 Tax=Sphingosinicella sp. YJ22 TaxID=1104780 RepID=UPI00140B8EA4|nr:DUF4129 domain-containing protein [Sphingosinicella sp. YJ22]
MLAKRPESSDAERAIQPLDGFDEAHRALLDDRAIQFRLEPFQPPRMDPPPDLSGLVNLAPFFRVMFWVLVAAAVLFLLYLIVSRLTGFSLRRRGEAEAGEPEWHMAEQPARQLLGDADALAAKGLFSEAAHLLLFRSIEEIDQRRPDTIRRALTSRDIAGLPSLPHGPADSFRAIVRAVERSLFGGRDLDAEDWRECRTAYERFAFPESWRG